MTDLSYSLSIEETIKTAWNKVSGAKGTIWAALIILFAVALGLGLVNVMLSAMLPKVGPVFNVVFQVLIYLLDMGILYIGIKRAMDMPISYGLVFHAFSNGLPVKIILLYILQILICFIPVLLMLASAFTYDMEQASGQTFLFMSLSILLFVAGLLGTIYITIRLMLSMGFVLDKQMSPINAIKSSFRATQCNFWNIFFIFLLQSLIIAISAIPLGIGLIWTIPFSLINYGVIYKNLSTNNLKINSVA